MTLTITDDAIDFLADKGYDSKYGARPLRRTIQTQIEDQLSEKILEGTIRQKNRGSDLEKRRRPAEI